MHQTWPAQCLLLIALTPVLDSAAAMRAYEPSGLALVALASSAVTAFAANVSSLLALGLTSALALVLLGQAKTCAILFAGYLLFDRTPTARAAFGAALAIVSIGGFTYVSGQPSLSTLTGASGAAHVGRAEPRTCAIPTESEVCVRLHTKPHHRLTVS